MSQKWIALFPGQGSQFVGMDQPFSGFPNIYSAYQKADELLRFSLSALCKSGPEQELQLTSNAQPAILTTSIAWWQLFRQEVTQQAPIAACGHSLGEYSALVAANALTLEEAIVLVHERGRLMQQTVPEGKGAMAAILGLEAAQVEALCEEVSQKDGLVTPANYNSPLQIVISGHTLAVARASQRATEAPYGAKRVIPLKVSAPFHCPLMTPVAEAFEPLLKNIAWKAPHFFVSNNVDAKYRKEDFGYTLLKDQIDHPVRFTQGLQNLEALAPDFYIEFGPQKVLTGLAKKIVQKPIYSCESLADLEKLKEIIR